MTQPIIEQVYEALVRHTSISSKSLANRLQERPWVVPNALMRLKQQGRATNTTDPETGAMFRVFCDGMAYAKITKS